MITKGVLKLLFCVALACVASVVLTLVFDLDKSASFLVGMVCGSVGGISGMIWAMSE